MITADWLASAVAAINANNDEDVDSVRLLRELLTESALGFAEVRPDVISAAVVWPRRGLHTDEAASFLRAVDLRLVSVDVAGYVTVHCVRPKTPPGRYALFSRSGDGVAVNLEYLIQIGTAAELVVNLGWPPSQVEFERGEFDALGLAPDGRVVLAVEAKARATGPDSLQTMLVSWITFAAASDDAPATNSGRKYRELLRLCESGPIALWLVAAGARWSFVATANDGRISLVPASTPTYERVVERPKMPERALEVTQDEFTCPRCGSTDGPRGTKKDRELIALTCEDCGHFWTRVPRQSCKRCGSVDIESGGYEGWAPEDVEELRDDPSGAWHTVDWATFRCRKCRYQWRVGRRV
jgi:predicted RNA-binding Zn-ribbon protein involved in translation (DUF1610 family)